MAILKRSLKNNLNYLFGQASWSTRFNTARAHWAARRGSLAPPPPSMLQVEVTNRCNINCLFCSRHEAPLELGDLAPSFYDPVEAMSARVQEVALFGYGEPLLSRAFYDLLPRLRSSRLGFFTNGVLLDGRLFDKIINQAGRPLSYIVFSIDGGTASTYERLRPGASFDRLMANLEEVAGRRQTRSMDFILRIEFVAMRDNIQELPRLIDLADRAGADYIKVSHLVAWDESMRDQSLYYHQEEAARGFAAALEAARSRRILLDLPKTIGAAPPGWPPCRLPWLYAMISFDGEVRACCFAPELIMGDLKQSSFADIWRNQKYQDLRRDLSQGRGPDCCQTCEERFRQMASPDEEATYIKLTPRKK